MQYVQKACRSCGIDVVAYHAQQANLSDHDTEEKRVARVDRCKRQIETNLDVGHERNTDGADPMTPPEGLTLVLQTCGRHLRIVPMHGFKDGIDHIPPFVEGDALRWIELFHMLRATGSSGHLNFEPEGEPKHLSTVAETTLAPKKIVETEARTKR